MIIIVLLVLHNLLQLSPLEPHNPLVDDQSSHRHNRKLKSLVFEEYSMFFLLESNHLSSFQRVVHIQRNLDSYKSPTMKRLFRIHIHKHTQDSTHFLHCRL